jgi:hypothetical protein
MTSSERYPGISLRRACPVAVSLAAHLVLVLAWLHFGRPEPVIEETPRTLSVLLLPRPASAPPSLLPPGPATPARKPHRTPGPATERLRTNPVAPSQPEQPSTVLTVPASDSAKPSAWDILNAARQDIRNSRNARTGKMEALRQGDGKWTRFEERMAAAHVDRSPEPVTESYTAPDGLTYYRTRVGDKVVCRKTGSSGPPAPWRSEEAIRAGAGSMATLDVGNSAGTTLCPGGKRDWVRN